MERKKEVSLSTGQHGEWWRKASVLAIARNITIRHIATYIASCRAQTIAGHFERSGCDQRSRFSSPIRAAVQIFFQRLLTACSYKKCPESLNQCRTDPLQIASCYPYGSDSPGRGKWSKCGIFLFFLKLCCDQTVIFFQPLSTVLKRFCPLDAKNVLPRPTQCVLV